MGGGVGERERCRGGERGREGARVGRGVGVERGGCKAEN
jgi:hypothetical protein